MPTETPTKYERYRAAMDAAHERLDLLVEEAGFLREEHFRVRASGESDDVKNAAAIARTASGLRAGKQVAKWIEEMKAARKVFLEER